MPGLDVRMPLTIYIPTNFIIVVSEDDAAGGASKAPRMELLRLIRLEILAFDSAIAAFAERSIELVIMLFTIGEVIKDIEICAREGRATGPADEAFSMITASKASRGVFD